MGEVGYEPPRPGMIRPRRLDQLWVDIDSYDVVSSLVECGRGATRSAASIEDPRMRRNHRVDETGLTGKVRTLGSQVPEPVDVALRVVVVRVGEPAGRFRHVSTVLARLESAGWAQE